MQFPDDTVLLARGKYSTLSRERRKQLERIQSTCGNVMALCSQAMKGAQQEIPDVSPVLSMRKCVDNLEAASEAVAELTAGMAEIKEEAWG